MNLLLFDIDGVLLEAYGYLRALQDTVAYYSEALGVGRHPPTEIEARTFEARGITSEWDSVPMCIAALLVERVRREPALVLPPSWPKTLALLSAHPMSLPHPDYVALAEQVGARFRHGVAVAHIVRDVLWERTQAFPATQRDVLRVLLDALLAHTRDFAHSPVTQHFQIRAIGSQGVADTYAVTPTFQVDPYLQTYDVAHLESEPRARLLQALAEGRVRAAIYTARPSLPPSDVDVSPMGYSPEAELARESVGLASLPLIGLGRMHWLAHQVGVNPGLLVKPSPVQALAAIAAAWSGQEAAALRAAFALHNEGTLKPPLEDLEDVTVMVFEDTATGIAAVERAVTLLQDAGRSVRWHPYGIAPAGSPKVKTLNAQGIRVYESINTALLDALC